MVEVEAERVAEPDAEAGPGSDDEGDGEVEQVLSDLEEGIAGLVAKRRRCGCGCSKIRAVQDPCPYSCPCPNSLQNQNWEACWMLGRHACQPQPWSLLPCFPLLESCDGACRCLEDASSLNR